MAEKIVCDVVVRKIIYQNDDYFHIVLVEPVGEINESLTLDRKGQFIMKGTMFNLQYEEVYNVTLRETVDSKYGTQYWCDRIVRSNQESQTDDVKRSFLEMIFTPKQVESMYEALEDPYSALQNKDYHSLVTVNGCGMKTASSWCVKMEQEAPFLLLYTQLKEYKLTATMLHKILDHYKSPELAIDRIKENPYVLCEIAGIGWKKADQIALRGGMEPFSLYRVKQFIIYFLETQAENGFSYVTPDELLNGILENIGEDVPDLVIGEAMHALQEEVLWWSDDKELIGLKRFKELEDNIAFEIKRLLEAKGKLTPPDNWRDIVKAQEEKQGWEYTDEQREGIKIMLENNLTIIHGLAGVGKSSLVDIILKIFPKVTFAQTALAGRAAARLAEVTGQEGHTIHRLLGYPDPQKVGKNGFVFHDENQLSYDMIIVDEVSMIDGYLFYYLLRAIKSGTKVLLLGDIGQLESIGVCNVAKDLINSPYVPTVYLSKIHRQAQASAIITESIKVRMGQQIVPKDYVGTEIRGELQDLEVICYSDASNTFYNVLQQFSKAMAEETDIMEIQVIVPVKSNGGASTKVLNLSLQDLWNSESPEKAEAEVKYPSGEIIKIREGDKVINVKNDYKVALYDGTGDMKLGLFNGNTGIVKKIEDGIMTIDFLGLGVAELSADKWENIELAYALTCHKCQGSQYKYVIVGIDFNSYALLSRQLIYTALTRARKYATLVTQTSALRYAVSVDGVSEKRSHLLQSLEDLYSPKFVF